MLLHVARFEARYVLRNPLLWVTAAAAFTLFIVGASVDGFDLGNEGGLLKNAAYATLRNYVMASVFFMFVTTSFVASAVLRDDETGYGPIIRSTGITKRDYVLGRFLGAFAVAALCLLVVPLASVLGSLMPWAPAAQLGPNRLGDYVYGYFLLALPNLFIHAAVFFALATTTRSMMATYLGVIGFIFGFFVLQEAFAGEPQVRTAVALGEPFAARALIDAVRYWTVAQRNETLPDFADALLYNRLLWIGIGVGCLAIACVAFRFADQRLSRRDRKKLKGFEIPSEASDLQLSPLAAPTHGAAALRALLWMRTKFETRQVVLSPAFVVVVVWGIYTTLFVLLTQRYPVGRPTYPTTLMLIPKINLGEILLVLAIFYAGEVVWRERDRKIHEIIDATPLPNWAYVVPKTLAMAIVLMAMLLVNVATSVGFQLSLGYTDVELGKYLLWYVLPEAWDILLLAVLAIFVQAISPHKTIGWAVMVMFLIWQSINKVIDHNLLNFGETPGMPLSDMNGAGSFWQGAWTLRAYWGAFAVLLLIAAHLLWRRGTEIRLRPRLAAARHRLSGAMGLVAGATLVAFGGTGAFAFYNMNVLNEYHSPTAGLAHEAAFEKKYWKYIDLPQPTIASMTLAIDLYPAERRAVTKGTYVLRNTTSQTITDVHVRLVYDDLELTSAKISDAQLVVDDGEFDYRIYRLASPMQPGEERMLTFETRRWHRGFRNGPPDTRLVENGTFLDSYRITPVIGMSRAGTIDDPTARRYYGLPEFGGRPRPEEVSATTPATTPGGWTTADIILSTSADQTPIAPGRRVSDVVRDGRRTARFVSEAPIRESFSVQSARYAEKHRQHAGVDLVVYYHAAHAWNVDRMLDALAVSLDYYRASFGPYPFDHARIVEYPGYANFAQAFAGTVPYSETYGFISDFHKPETVDHVSATTAHELAHMYWGHQVVGADVQGSSLLTEMLANYSAFMFLKRHGGDGELRRALEFTLNRYLGGRGGGSVSEPPLVRVENESWISYQKGALAMYLLQERLGEDAINRALRSLLGKFRFKGAPYPTSLDLVAALRAEAKTSEEQALITDLFERVVLYDLKVTAEPTAVHRADGKWEVTVTVEAKKLYVDEKGQESEAPLAERIDVGLFAVEPGFDELDSKSLVVMERPAIRSGAQVFKFVTDRRPTHAGVDPYNYYIDRNSGDNVRQLKGPK